MKKNQARNHAYVNFTHTGNYEKSSHVKNVENQDNINEIGYAYLFD